MSYTDIIPWISSLGCQVSNNSGWEYRGNISTTESGLTCKKWRDVRDWASTSPPYNSDHNYCRNYSYGKTRVWCWTTDDRTPSGRNEWEYCDLPICGDEGKFISKDPVCSLKDWLCYCSYISCLMLLFQLSCPA